MPNLRIVPRIAKNDITLPWMVVGKDEKASDSAWQRLPGVGGDVEGDGPIGVYVDGDASAHNKNVYVIEGEDSLLPQMPVADDHQVGIGLPPQNEFSDIRLNAVMTTRNGVRIANWDVYKGGESMIIGETDHFFIMRQTMPKFNWSAWFPDVGAILMNQIGQVGQDFEALKASDQTTALVKDVGTGAGYRDQRHGNQVLGWRIVPVSGDTTAPFRPIEYPNQLITGPIFTSDPQFRYRPEFGSPHVSSFSGEKYWKLPKGEVKKAIQVNIADYDFPTINPKPSHIVEITWMPESEVTAKGEDSTPWVDGNLWNYTGDYASYSGATRHHRLLVLDWMNPTELTADAKGRRLTLTNIRAAARNVHSWDKVSDSLVIGGHLPTLSTRTGQSVVSQGSMMDVIRISYVERYDGQRPEPSQGNGLAYLERSTGNPAFSSGAAFHSSLKFSTHQYQHWGMLEDIKIDGDKTLIPLDLLRESPHTPQKIRITRIDLYVGDKIVMRH